MPVASTEPPPVFHIARRGEWEAGLAAGAYEPPGFAEEGFVHCSRAEQVLDTATRYYADEDDLVLVRLRGSAVAADLVVEEVRPGASFPHLYRPVATADVEAVAPLRRDAGGSFSWPEELARD